jgi:hypothetical protein
MIKEFVFLCGVDIILKVVDAEFLAQRFSRSPVPITGLSPLLATRARSRPHLIVPAHAHSAEPLSFREQAKPLLYPWINQALEHGICRTSLLNSGSLARRNREVGYG